jgi:hypothetical protein
MIEGAACQSFALCRGHKLDVQRSPPVLGIYLVVELSAEGSIVCADGEMVTVPIMPEALE